MFTLTLTLCLRERGHNLPLPERERGQNLPLPQGEGRGEG